MNYIPPIEDVRVAHQTYDEVITTLVLSPKKIIEAYRLLTGDKEALVNQNYAHRYVHSYFYYKKYLSLYPDYEQKNETTEEVQQNNSTENQANGNETTNDMPETTHNNATDELTEAEKQALNTLDSLFGLTEEEADSFDKEKEELLTTYKKLKKELKKKPKDRSIQVRMGQHKKKMRAFGLEVE